MTDAAHLSEPFLGLPWPAWGGLCLFVAVIWFFVWPHPRAHSSHVFPTILLLYILRFGHSLVWLLLALSCFARSWQATAATALPRQLALLALAAYLLFLGALVYDRWHRIR